MEIAYVVVTLVAAGMNTFAAVVDFTRRKWVMAVLKKCSVPESWTPTLGVFKLLGAIGLVLGFRYPVLGSAAAIGLMMFFVCAIVIHLRAEDRSFGGAVFFLSLAAGSFALEMQARGLAMWMLSGR